MQILSAAVVMLIAEGGWVQFSSAPVPQLGKNGAFCGGIESFFVGELLFLLHAVF